MSKEPELYNKYKDILIKAKRLNKEANNARFDDDEVYDHINIQLTEAVDELSTILSRKGGRRRSSSARKSSSRRDRRSSKKRGTQRKQKRRQRRGSRRA
jgi:hypothetical protein